MPELQETQLPGVGQRVEFVSDDGNRIGVVHHHTGRRELFVCTPADPDAVAMSLDLTETESHALADALGGTSIVESLTSLPTQIEGLAIDWLNIAAESPFANKAIGEARVRTRTGVSIVAVLRGDQAHPAPGPQFELLAGDVAVVVGTTDGIDATREILTSG